MDAIIPRTENLDEWYERIIADSSVSEEDKAYIRLMKRWADKGRRSSSQKALIAQQAEQIKNMADRVMNTTVEDE